MENSENGNRLEVNRPVVGNAWEAPGGHRGRKRVAEAVDQGRRGEGVAGGDDGPFGIREVRSGGPAQWELAER